MSTGEQQQLADTFVSLADTLVDDFDLLDFLGLLAEKASQHLNVTAAGVILTDQRGGWRPTATSDESPQLVALFTTGTYEGPCRECVRTGSRVTMPNLAEHAQRWPDFAAQATQAGYHAAAAVPMRSHRQIIGSLTLLNTTPDGVDEASLALGQSLADMATIGLLQQHAAHRGDLLAEQLQAVLHHRVVLEQAKGTLAEHSDLTSHAAYVLLRDYARSQGLHLSELARHIATTTDLADLDPILVQASRPHTHPGT